MLFCLALERTLHGNMAPSSLLPSSLRPHGPCSVSHSLHLSSFINTHQGEPVRQLAFVCQESIHGRQGRSVHPPPLLLYNKVLYPKVVGHTPNGFSAPRTSECLSNIWALTKEVETAGDGSSVGGRQRMVQNGPMVEVAPASWQDEQRQGDKAYLAGQQTERTHAAGESDGCDLACKHEGAEDEVEE